MSSGSCDASTTARAAAARGYPDGPDHDQASDDSARDFLSSYLEFGRLAQAQGFLLGLVFYDARTRGVRLGGLATLGPILDTRNPWISPLCRTSACGRRLRYTLRVQRDGTHRVGDDFIFANRCHNYGLGESGGAS